MLLKTMNNYFAEMKTSSTLQEYLFQDLKILEDIGNRINDTVQFEEVTSLSLKYSDTRGVYPIFVIPSIQFQSLEPILQKLVYPVFSATLTSSYYSTQEVASKLFHVSTCRRIIAWGKLK